MRAETPETSMALRSGYTTGACATATSLAAARLLLTGQTTTSASIELPRGQIVEFALTGCTLLDATTACASTIKDAGDDPDATHGATVFARVTLAETPGVRFHAAEGVGTVTREGLSIGIGEPAINPVPRQMMQAHLAELASSAQYTGGFDVHIGIEDGERIAGQTMNARLGILGGLSILGTTGIVRPFSCAAYIASIHQAIDVAHANGLEHIAACTGSTSERYIQQYLRLPDMGVVEMGDFAGAVLKHLRRVPMQRLSLCGGFGKITKLAAGHTSLHSQHAAIDFLFLATVARDGGATDDLCQQIEHCNTSLEALTLCQQADIDLAGRISTMARHTASIACLQKLAIDVYCVDRQGACVGNSLGGGDADVDRNEGSGGSADLAGDGTQ